MRICTQQVLKCENTMTTRSIQLPTGEYLTFRVPEDAVMLNIVRLILVASRNPAAAEPLVAILGEYVASPIDQAAIQQLRDAATPQERAKFVTTSDAALWICLLIQRHGAGLMMQIQLTLLGPVQPHRPEKPKPKGKKQYGKARTA
jgi:hypothetical protein